MTGVKNILPILIWAWAASEGYEPGREFLVVYRVTPLRRRLVWKLLGVVGMREGWSLRTLLFAE